MGPDEGAYGALAPAPVEAPVGLRTADARSEPALDAEPEVAGPDVDLPVASRAAGAAAFLSRSEVTATSAARLSRPGTAPAAPSTWHIPCGAVIAAPPRPACSSGLAAANTVRRDRYGDGGA
ncbi:hypothetical protein M878_03675 [Streptomyces roseochromogenus subsp. oscitans DS 12.976]|uniref:Uncharacterized protein n=1 Tax=Streptomyces roseochromogenus subsp. oscitans DS 12.976 TaxID=1352936 RepID=V6KV08_STRRC|nr:hypothetical protein M878_03675 [Streptomyces roseochromogenus subsp. oscitans DS 12.976]